MLMTLNTIFESGSYASNRNKLCKETVSGTVF